MIEISPSQRSDTTRKLAIEAARLAANTRGQNVVLLDVSRLSPVTDYFIIATGTSARQMRTVCNEIAEMAAPLGFKPLSTSGYDGENWILVDFVDVVVHVFNEASRLYYDLEGLWGDAVRIDWQEGARSSTSKTNS